MTFKSSLIAMAALLCFGAKATEFRSADIHNADDYPTVVAVKHMSTVLEKASGGKHKIKVFNKGAHHAVPVPLGGPHAQVARWPRG